MILSRAEGPPGVSLCTHITSHCLYQEEERLSQLGQPTIPVTRIASDGDPTLSDVGGLEPFNLSDYVPVGSGRYQDLHLT